MKRLYILLTLAIAITSCKKDNDSDSIDLQKESDAIKNLVSDSYSNALKNSNATAVAAAFTTDGVVMGPGSPTASGSAQLKSTYEGIFASVGLNLNFNIDEVIVGQNYGFVRSTSAGTATVKASGASFAEENRELFVVKKISGEWKIARYIYNKMGVLNQANSTKIIENKAMSSSNDDSKAINTLITTSYSNAIASANAQTVSEIFTSDGVLMAPDAPTMIGRTAIKGTYESVFSTIGLDLSFAIDEIVIDGEYGYVRSHSTGTALIRANNQTVPANYREIFVVKKVDGSWKIAWYKYNQPS